MEITAKLQVLTAAFVICSLYITGVSAATCSEEAYIGYYSYTTYSYCSTACCGSYYSRYCCSSYYYYYSYYANDWGHFDAAKIAGGVVGGAVGVFIAVVIICVVCAKKKTRATTLVVPNPNMATRNMAGNVTVVHNQLTPGFAAPPPYGQPGPVAPPPYAAPYGSTIPPPAIYHGPHSPLQPQPGPSQPMYPPSYPPGSVTAPPQKF